MLRALGRREHVCASMAVASFCISVALLTLLHTAPAASDTDTRVMDYYQYRADKHDVTRQRHHAKHHSPQEEDSPKKEIYGMVLDAGSTGTRIHVYTFTTGGRGSSLKLQDELFEEVKPGLSAYASSPSQARLSIGHLLSKAQKRVHTPQWGSTPVCLRATAGLRLLPHGVGNAIMAEVRKELRSSSLRVCNTCVSIMDGKDEGIYSWITINYLAERLPDPTLTATTLDLGGGSTQITFLPTTDDVISDLHDVMLPIIGKARRLYVRSYLGLGLMSARNQVLALSRVDDKEKKEIHVTSSCFYPKTLVYWEHNQQNFTIQGAVGRPCEDLCKEVVVSGQVQAPAELRHRPVYAFSYFYDRAVDAGLLQGDGGIITLSDYLKAAKKACSSHDQDFLCLDLTFITSLLKYGYNFPDHKEFFVYKKIREFETSWSLGAVFDML